MVEIISIKLFFILGSGFFLTLLLSYLYVGNAYKLKILFVEPNFRSSHNQPTPTGAGIIFALVYIVLLFFLILLEELNSIFLVTALSIGAISATLFGFYDDLYSASTRSKLILQILLGLWVLFIFGNNIFIYLEENFGVLTWISFIFVFFLLVWFSNAINFMDGINGMLGSSTILIMFSASLLTFLAGGYFENIVLCLLLTSVTAPFLLFNFPRASIFMGDSGSLFIGYIISSLMIKSVIDGDLSFWTWAILLGHVFIEPSITTILRMKLTRAWYEPHRSCAYQNLSRKLSSHKKVTTGAVLFHIIWLLPLATFSLYFDALGLVIYFFSILPIVIFTVKYGPLYSSK